MTNDVLIDGRQLTWQEFADRLTALREAPPHESAPGYLHAAGYVYAPRACGREASRLIRHLDLADRIAVIAPVPEAASRAGRLWVGRLGRVGAALARLGADAVGHRPLHWD